MTLANSRRIKKIEDVEVVGLVCVGRMLRMGCNSLLMRMRGSVGGWDHYEGRMGYHGNKEYSVEDQWGEGG